MKMNVKVTFFWLLLDCRVILGQSGTLALVPYINKHGIHTDHNKHILDKQACWVLHIKYSIAMTP